MNFANLNAHWLLRIAFASVFIFHGVLKLTNVAGFAQMLPISYTQTLLVALTETAGGVLVLAGGLGSGKGADLATRLGAAINIPVLIGAIVLVHWGRWNFVPTDSHPLGGFEFQAVLLLIAAFLSIKGNDRNSGQPLATV